MSEAQDSLARLTLRQLRHKASELSVPLYSRKSKATLIKEIILRQEKQSSGKYFSSFWQAPEDKTNKPDPKSALQLKTETRVVFLPRDPQ